MGFHGLVDIEARECLYIKSFQPHGTDKDDTQSRVTILKLLVKFLFFHPLTMRKNVKPPLLECLYLVLLLRYNYSHIRFAHPLQFALHLLHLLLRITFLDSLFQRFDFALPVFLHIVVHADTRHLVVTDEHSLTRCPQVAIVADKVLSHQSQTLLGCQ